MLSDDALPLEVWGGVECTVNRVGDRYRDQLCLTGHHDRLDDLDRLAALGLRTLRYPVLWERVVRDGRDDWSWSDTRLERLRQLGVDPIVGLVHHGSGPPSTHLLDPGFAPGVAAFARRVAERYPWVTRYTVVNEPLTTARFAGLYGHWYPHGRSDAAFTRALVHQCQATVLGMRAIREVQPQARLIQTEDVCAVHGTRPLAGLVRFYRDRRWLSFDLLCGRLTADHPLWPYLRDAGFTEEERDAFLAAPMPPDVIGVNYYATSDRVLDHRVDRYPGVPVDRSSARPFVDVEAVRADRPRISSHAARLREVWQRYHRPLAITEVHLGCTREEQLRWLRDAWRAARRARAAGIDVRAVTAWALFGSVDWDTLVVDDNGRYEPGAFDVRDGHCRPTALASAIGDLCRDGRVRHPAVAGGGWWQRRPRTTPAASGARRVRRTPPRHRRPLLITGGVGVLGDAVARICAVRGLAYEIATRDVLDITSRAQVDRAIDRHRPWAVVNCAGFARVNAAERDRWRCWRENVLGTRVLAGLAAARGLPLVTFSSHLVFDGRTTRPYTEDDDVGPLSVYGRSKVNAERAVARLWPEALVVRTAALFGPWDASNAVTRAMRSLAAGRAVTLPGTTTVSPTYLPDLVHTCLDLLIDGQRGVWHLTNPAATTMADLLREAAVRLHLPADLIHVTPSESERAGRAARPPYSVLATQRTPMMPPLTSALDRYVQAVQPFG